MKSRFYRLLLAFGLLCSVWASAQDALLQSYELAEESLSEAVSALEQDPSLSSEALDRAANALRPLSSDTTSPQLPGALQAVFERAQTAIDNRSPTDLAVQVAVIRGGLQRLIYESALRAANDNELATTRQYLQALAEDNGLTSDLGSPETLQSLLAAFDLGVAQQVQAQLERAESLRDSERGSAYVALASAYGVFFVVQDSPRLSQALSGSFSQAFQALVDDEAESFQAALAQLQGSMASFAEAASSAVSADAASVPEAAGASSESAAPESLPLLEGESALEPEEAESPPQGEAAAAQVPGDASEVVSESAAAGPEADEALAQRLSAYDLNAAVRDQLVAQYRAQGYGSVEAVLDRLYGDSARALVAIQSADQAGAQAALGAFDSTYRRLLAPLLQPSELNGQTEALLNRLLASPDLRQQDVAVLIGQVDSARRTLENQQLATTQQLMLASQPLWSGWLRLGVMVVLAILAFIPLRLLNLAFGGANRNWRLVGAALFLLLLPVIYEGLSALLAISGELAGIGALQVLSAYSIFQNTLSQLVWAVLSAVAIALAISGLYGICQQFGLLGQRSGRETVISTQESSLQRRGQGVEWDEEF